MPDHHHHYPPDQSLAYPNSCPRKYADNDFIPSRLENFLDKDLSFQWLWFSLVGLKWFSMHNRRTNRQTVAFIIIDFTLAHLGSEHGRFTSGQPSESASTPHMWPGPAKPSLQIQIPQPSVIFSSWNVVQEDYNLLEAGLINISATSEVNLNDVILCCY